MEEDFKTTVSHTVIRSWVESHGGKPALIVDPNRLDTRVGLRIDFAGKTDEALLGKAHQNQPVSWDEFFKVFEDQALAFDYMEKPGSTDLVDAYRFLKREAVNETDSKPVIDPEEVAKAIRDDRPEFATHNGQFDNPQQGEIEPVVPEDVAGESEFGGDTPDTESDDDATKPAADLGITDPEDSQVKHDRE